MKIGLQIPPIEDDPDAVYDNFVKRVPGGNLDSYLSNYPKTLSSPGFYGGYTPFSDSY